MLYWIHSYGILLLYGFAKYANMLQMFFLSNLYRNHCCSFVHQRTVSVTQTPHDKERKWNVVCCAVSLWDLHVPVTDCYTVLNAWMRMFSLCYQRAREHVWHCLSLCAERRIAHRSVVWMCNQALNKNHDEETSVISVHLRSFTIVYSDSDLPTIYSCFV